jgi:hypothetical protein
MNRTTPTRPARQGLPTRWNTQGWFGPLLACLLAAQACGEPRGDKEPSPADECDSGAECSATQGDSCAEQPTACAAPTECVGAPSSIEVAPGLLSPEFRADRFEYTLRVPALQPHVAVRVAMDGGAHITANGRSLRANEVEDVAIASAMSESLTIVTCPQGAARTYAIAIQRYEARSSYLTGSSARKWNFFGASMAVSADGNTLAVGAPHQLWGSSSDDLDGRVYVFSKTPAGDWQEDALLRAWGREWPDQTFGRSVALSADGSTLAIGSNDARTLFVLHREPTRWVEAFSVKYDHPEFGGAVSLSDDGATLVVGARDGSGVVVAYERTGETWAQAAELRPAEPRLDSFDSNFFGRSVSLSGDGSTLAVGANPKDEDPGSGAVYIFVRESDGWLEQATLEAADPEWREWLGATVSLSREGNTLIAGAPGRGDSGAAYVFERASQAWAERGLLEAPDVSYGAHFGDAVSITGAGELVAIGAPYDGENEPGSVFVFVRDGQRWTLQKHFSPPAEEWHAKFGGALGLSRDGGLLAVGAESGGEQRDEGGAYLYDGLTLPTEP